MNLYSNTFPVKIENADDNTPVKLNAPYTITAALHTRNSHYVGYNITDVGNNSVEVYNVPEIKEYIKTHSREFTNARIGATGQLEIDNPLSLEQRDRLVYEGKLINQGLLDLLELEEESDIPSKVYKYNLTDDNSIVCSLRDDFREYIKTTNDTIVFPPILTSFVESSVIKCDMLFSDLDLRGKNVDFSFVDLRCYTSFNYLFKNTKIDNLDFSVFNINHVTSIKSLFIELECKTLSLKNCDFSNITEIVDCFNYAIINRVETEGCILNEELLKTVTASSIFNRAKINYLDLSLFKNIPPTAFVDASNWSENYSEDMLTEIPNGRHIDFLDNGKPILDIHEKYGLFACNCNHIRDDNFDRDDGWFAHITCKKLLNLEKLPLQMATSLDSFFSHLRIVDLDITKLRLNSLVNFDRLFYNLNCDNLKFKPQFFSRATSAKEMFKLSSIYNALDLKEVDFINLTQEGATNMFKEMHITGTLTIPKSFGLAENFDGFLSKIIANKVVISHSDFSKATSMQQFLMNSSIYTGITFPKNPDNIPKNLNNYSLMLSLFTPFVNIRGWDIHASSSSTDISTTIFDWFDAPYVERIKFSDNSRLLEACTKNKSIVKKYEPKISRGKIELKLKFKQMTYWRYDDVEPVKDLLTKPQKYSDYYVDYFEVLGISPY